jgi:hypothetical protein
MRSIAYALPALPGFTPPKTYAAWPVWRDSTMAEVKFQRMPKRQAVKLYHDARRFERQTRQPGRQDGALGRNGLAVLHAMLFDIINYASGRLEPGYAKIAGCISKVMQPKTTNRGKAMTTEMIDALETMTEAAQRVVDCWPEGNLAGAVTGLDCCIEPSRAALARARNDASVDLIEALEFVRMTFADIEASKRKGYYTECPKIVAAALAKVGR